MSRSSIYSELAVYANQRYHEDTGNAVYQKLTGEVQTLGVQMMQSISWFQPELLALPEARLTQYYAEEPKLEGYRRQVEGGHKNARPYPGYKDGGAAGEDE